MRRLILSRTVALTVKGGSRPLGPGDQVGFVGVRDVAGFLGLRVVFRVMGEEEGGVTAMDVTPAQVEGRGTGERETLPLEGARSMSFSARNIWLKFSIWRPVAVSSRTVGGPSMIVMRHLSSTVTTSSRKGA